MASLRLTTSVHGSTATIVGDGELTAGTGSGVVDAVSAQIDNGATAVILDLRAVVPDPLAAADALVAVAARAAESGVTVQLCAGDPVREALATGKALALFTAIDDAVAAAASVESLLVGAADAPPVNASDAEVTWITTDEPEAASEAS